VSEREEELRATVELHELHDRRMREQQAEGGVVTSHRAAPRFRHAAAASTHVCGPMEGPVRCARWWRWFLPPVLSVLHSPRLWHCACAPPRRQCTAVSHRMSGAPGNTPPGAAAVNHGRKNPEGSEL
jgi:hypothetical protein